MQLINKGKTDSLAALFQGKLMSRQLPCGGRFVTVSLRQAYKYPNFVSRWASDTRRFGDIYTDIEYLAAAEWAETGDIMLIRYDHKIGSVLRAVTLRKLNFDEQLTEPR